MTVYQKKYYAISKIMNFGEWDPVQDNSLPDLIIAILSIFHKVIMPDAEAITIKKNG